MTHIAMIIIGIVLVAVVLLVVVMRKSRKNQNSGSPRQQSQHKRPTFSDRESRAMDAALDAQYGSDGFRDTKYWVLFSFITLCSMLYAELEVSDVKVFSAYPWKDVMIAYTITGTPSVEQDVFARVVDKDTGKAYACVSVTGGGVSIGRHVLRWDAGADNVFVRTDNLVGEVFLSEKLLYCIVDLATGGISYVRDMPKDGWIGQYKMSKLVLRRISPGAFDMCGTCPVRITNYFYMGIYEVTQDQYKQIMGYNPSAYVDTSNGKSFYYPVERVSYDTIRGGNWPRSTIVSKDTFIEKLQAKTGKEFDLPTEAQWEYACRAGTKSYYNNGGNSTDDMIMLGRCADNKGLQNKHASVGSYLPNAWGLYDMHGNVKEWCLDRYGELCGGDDPKGNESGSYRVLRGGSYMSDAYNCRSSYRCEAMPSSSEGGQRWYKKEYSGEGDYAYDYYGFRIALVIRFP